MNGRKIVESLDLSAAAYRNIQPCSKHLCAAMIDDPQSGVQCFLRRQGDTLCITFRGSDSPKDWATDLTFWKKTIPYGNMSSKIRVHTGFINAYKAPGVRDRILRAVADGVRHVNISGHSLGAALSVLCAVDIEYNYPDINIEAIVFGCPRVGNRAFQESYNKRVNRTVRVENGNDVVTKVPFRFMGFRHVGALLHIGAPRVWGMFSAKDHYPHRYYQGLLARLPI